MINLVTMPFIDLCRKQNWIDQYFFIRYSELGSHIRLRLFGKKEILNETVLPAFEKHLSLTFPINLVPTLKNDGDNAKSYLLIEYIPELERYGGNRAVKIAEEYFFYSSELTLALLDSKKELNSPERLAKGLIAMLILLYLFSEDRESASQIMDNYYNGYLAGIAKDEGIKLAYKEAFNSGFEKQSEYLAGVIETVWSALETNEELPEPWNSYQINLRHIKDQLYQCYLDSQIDFGGITLSSFSETYKRIIPSYIHMMNNRLGIPVTNESYLAFLLSSSLKRQLSV